MGILDRPARDGLPGPSGKPGATGPFGGQVVRNIDAGGTVTINPIGGTDWVLNLESNITLAASNMNDGQHLVIDLVQDSVGSRTITLPGSWVGGSGIVFSTAPNSIDRLVVWQTDRRIFVKRVFTGVLPAMWTPASLTNKHDWFRADSIAQAENSEVLAWPNRYAGAVGLSAPNGAGTGPKFQDSFGAKYVEADGADNFLESTFAAISPPFLIGLVARVNELSGLVPVVCAPSGVAADIFVDGTSPRTWRAGNLVGPAASANFQTVVVHYINTTAGFIRVDGTEVTGSTGGAGFNGLRFARQTALSANYGQVDYGEFVLATKSPTGSDVADMENYLNVLRDQLNGNY